MSPNVVQVAADATPAEKRRARWANNLAATLDAQALTPKMFHRALLDAGLDVTQQAVYLWLNGTTAPAVDHQPIVAQVLRSSVAVLFPVAA